jgi:hypothetical protein
MKPFRLTRVRLSILTFLVFAIILGLAIFGMTRHADPVPTLRPTDLGAALVTHRLLPSLSYGVQAFLWWNETTRARDLEFVRMMRFQYVKQVFGWADIRPAASQPNSWTYADAVMDEVEYRQVKLIARLGNAPTWAIQQASSKPDDPPFDITAFGQYCGDLAARYKGRIVGYQVWNEPNLSREWVGKTPNAAAYVKVLAACYTAIKAADPAAIVISAGLAPTGTLSSEVIPDDQYLVALYQAGIGAYYDVLGLNAPGYKSSPETPPDDPSLNGNRWQAFRHVEDMRAIMVANGEGAKQVALLEVGWTIDPRDTLPGPDGTPTPNPYRWHAVTEDQQAQYLVGAYQYAADHWRPWISLITTIYLPNPDWTENNEEYWWSITTAGYNPTMRTAFIALANAARYINDQSSPPIGGRSNPYTPMPPRKP